MAQRGTEVLVLQLEQGECGELAGTAQQRVGGTGQLAVVDEVPPLGDAAFPGLVEALGGVLGDVSRSR